MTLTKPKASKSSQSRADIYLNVELEAHQERLRQVRCTFNVYLWALGTSVAVATAGVVLMFMGQPMEGSLSATAGSGATAMLSQITRTSSQESSKKLDRLTQELKERRKPPTK